MPVKEQQEESLSERVVREAVAVGMETPMRDSILEAVEESEGGKRGRARTLPLAGALVGIGVAAGYLLGIKGEELQSKDVSLESIEEPDVVEEVTGDEAEEGLLETEGEEEAPSSGSWVRRLVVAIGAIAAVALIRRRMQSGEEEEWEPIEEFETSVPSPGSADEDEGEEEAEAEEAEEDEGEGEEMEAEAGDEDEEEEEE